jgi:predicted nucleotide-binding protein
LLLRPPKSGKEKIYQIRSNKILVVHGQDNEMKLEVTQTLQKLELDPILLDENPNITQNIIENIEEYDHISFAVVILTPNYLAYPNEKNLSEAKYIAKQNVIFELGYFLGKLGKQNVIVMYKKMKYFEIPNYNGIIWIEYKNGWYFDLIKELKERNFDVDANKLGWL